MNSTDKIKAAEQALLAAEQAAKQADPVRKAREALEQAQREMKAQEEAARQAKYKAEREEEARKRLVHVTALVKGLNAAGLKSAMVRAADPDSTYFENRLPGVESGMKGLNIHLEAETSSSGWRSTPTGRMICVVDAWQLGAERKRRFPQKTNGGFSFDKIVAYVEELQATAALRAVQEANRKAKVSTAEEIAEGLRSEYGLDKYGPVKAVHEYSLPRGPRGSEYRQQVPEEGKVFVSVGTLQCTPEQAREVLDLLIKQGRVTKK